MGTISRGLILLLASATLACTPAFVGEGGTCRGDENCQSNLVCKNDTCVLSGGPDAGLPQLDSTDGAPADLVDAGDPGQSGTLFAVSNDLPAQLLAIDPVSLAQTPIGSLGTLVLYGDCAWHPIDRALYVVDGLKQSDISGSDELFRVDIDTGTATLVGSHGIPKVFALAYHPPSNALYGISGTTNGLYRFDSMTAAATLIAPVNITSINGLSWDSKRDRMVALTASLSGAQLYSLDVNTGNMTFLKAMPGINNNGLTYEAGLDRHFAVDADGKLFSFDPNAAYASTLAAELGTGYSCIAAVPPMP